jgi:hypothetical protein
VAVDWSGFDLTSGSIIRSGVGFVGCALAVAIWRSKPRSRAIAWAAVALLGLGFASVTYNLFGIDAYNEGIAEAIADQDPATEAAPPPHDVTRAGLWIDAAGNGAAAVAACIAAVLLLRELRSRKALAIAGAVGAVIFLGVTVLAAFHPDGPDSAVSWADTLGYAGAITALAFLAACVAARARQGGDGAWTPSMLVILAWVLATETAGIVGYGFGGLAESSQGGWYLVAAPMLVVALVMLVGAARGRAGRAGWISLLALLATALAAEVTAVTLEDGDAVTESMESGFTFLAYAALGVVLVASHPAGRRIGRAALAALSLALLFATAEVVQNFTSNEVGLYAGGAVAFLTVLLANPIQRRLEGTPAPASAAKGSVEKYRRLVETAWKDGALGANERLLLAEARRQLGLGAEAAAAIDEEVAAGHASRGAGTKRRRSGA